MLRAFLNTICFVRRIISVFVFQRKHYYFIGKAFWEKYNVIPDSFYTYSIITGCHTKNSSTHAVRILPPSLPGARILSQTLFPLSCSWTPYCHCSLQLIYRSFKCPKWGTGVGRPMTLRRIDCSCPLWRCCLCRPRCTVGCLLSMMGKHVGVSPTACIQTVALPLFNCTTLNKETSSVTCDKEHEQSVSANAIHYTTSQKLPFIRSLFVFARFFITFLRFRF